jgi:hypothetical protein
MGYSVHGMAHDQQPIANSDNEEWMVLPDAKKEEIKLHGRLVPLD